MDSDFLRSVLVRLGLGLHMLRWISALYESPRAQVSVNEGLTSVFPLWNGMRQGCPHSHPLFALVLEPLLRKIRSNPNISGVPVDPTEHKLLAYVDNVLFHIVNPIVSLPNLIQDLSAYSLQVSNFQINYTKLESLPVTVPSATASALQGSFPFTWASSSMRYLGIHLTDNLNTLYAHNYVPLL